MPLSADAKSDLQWWTQNLPCAFRPILPRVTDIEVFTDASLEGWGAFCPKANIQTNGRWNLNEARFHINYLELLAVLHALKSFKADIQKKTVSIAMDNATGVSYKSHGRLSFS